MHFAPASRAPDDDAQGCETSSSGGETPAAPAPAGVAAGPRRTKRTIIIRHARSTWNEFLLAAQGRAEVEVEDSQKIGIRSALVSIVRRPGIPGEEPDDVAVEGPQPRHRFWQGVRGGVKHVVKTVSHANRLNQVDHQLSAKGIVEARALRASILGVCKGSLEAPAPPPTTQASSVSSSPPGSWATGEAGDSPARGAPASAAAASSASLSFAASTEAAATPTPVPASPSAAPPATESSTPRAAAAPEDDAEISAEAAGTPTAAGAMAAAEAPAPLAAEAAVGAEAAEAAEAVLEESPCATTAATPASPLLAGTEEESLGEGLEHLLLECKLWFVSPFLRAVQTAAYALSPLHRRDPEGVQIRITPMANEIVKANFCQDCQTRQGNVGFHVVARALSKTIETLLEEDDEDHPTRSRSAPPEARQEELADIADTLCAMDLQEVAGVWWPDLGVLRRDTRRREDSRGASKSAWLSTEDDRVRRLVALLLREKAEVVGLVGHSLLFQRILQLFAPSDDPELMRELHASSRGGDAAVNPLHAKIMNCGTVVLTWSYCDADDDADMEPRLVGARFLFGGHFERAGQGDAQGRDRADAEAAAALGNFIGEAM